MSDWQPIESAPPFDQAVLVRTADGSIMQAFRVRAGGSDRYVTKFAGYVVEPRHWMPLPEPPR